MLHIEEKTLKTVSIMPEIRHMRDIIVLVC